MSYLIQVAEMTNAEYFPSDLIEPKSQTQVVFLPCLPNNLAAVNVGWHYHSSHSVTEPFWLLSTIL